MKDDFVYCVNEDGSPGGKLKLVHTDGMVKAISTKTQKELVIAYLYQKEFGGAALWGVVSPFKKRDVRWANSKKQAIEILRRMAAPYRNWEESAVSNREARRIAAGYGS